MDMQYSREFIALADLGSFSEAADVLFLAQSTLSRHIQALEKELGSQLFRRTTRRVELTELGKKYYPYAKRMVEAEDECEAALTRESRGHSQVLTCLVTAAVAKYGIADILRQVGEEHPDWKVNIIVKRNNAAALELMKAERGDLAVLREASEKPDGDASRVTFLRDPYLLIVPAGHRLAGESSVSYSQLQDEHVILLPEDNIQHRKYLSGCRAAGFVPQNIQIAYPSETLIDMVRMNLGISLLLENRVAHIQDSKIRAIRLTPPEYVYINLLCPARGGISETARAALTTFKRLSGVRQAENTTIWQE